MSASEKCRRCGVYGVRLYREAGVFRVHLACTTCAEKLTGGSFDPDMPHAIGWYVLAVSDGYGNYWGYTSVPQHLVARWELLPIEGDHHA